MTTVETIPAALAGERLDRVVAMVLGCSRSEAAAAVDQGSVLVNGTTVTTRSHRLLEGDVVALPDAPGGDDAPLAPDPSVPVPLVHQDEHLFVVDKPAGLVVHPGAGHQTGTLVHGLLAIDPAVAEVGEPERPGIVHRLDRDTSGLLVVARTADAYQRLVAALADHEVERRYLALVWGHPAAAAGMVDAPIGRSRRTRTRMAVSADGRDARTRYQVLQRWADPEVALLSCELETGRTHQIRVHLAAIGHPVVGDEQYGGVRQSLDVPRIVLHATELAFAHPVNGVQLAFESPLPADLDQVLAGLGEPVGDGAR